MDFNIIEWCITNWPVMLCATLALKFLLGVCWSANGVFLVCFAWAISFIASIGTCFIASDISGGLFFVGVIVFDVVAFYAVRLLKSAICIALLGPDLKNETLFEAFWKRYPTSILVRNDVLDGRNWF